MWEKDTRQEIGNIFGEARQILLRNGNKSIKNTSAPDEIYFCIEKIDSQTFLGKRQWVHALHGYMKVTPEMKDIFKSLIQERREHFNINFIEWSDGTFNVVFQDGMHISSKSCKLSKEDFMAFEKTIIPCQKKN